MDEEATLDYFGNLSSVLLFETVIKKYEVLISINGSAILDRQIKKQDLATRQTAI